MAPIIFVWIGESLPAWFFKSLSFAAAQNPNRKILMVVNCHHKSLNSISSLVKNIEIINFKIDTPLTLNSNKLIHDSDFWLYTSLRFWYLKKLIEIRNITEFFHAELDNAIFSLGDLDNRLNALGEGIFVPRDSSKRAIASLIYCNRPRQCLDELIGIYGGENYPKHDMEALGIYANKYSHHFFALPTESFYYNSKKWNLLSPMIVNGIFDAASIGQYLLGVDPVCLPHRPSWNGFINENCKVKWDFVNITSDKGQLFLRFYGHFADNNFPLYNLHLHSKNWQALHNVLNNQSFLKKLQRGEFSIISGRKYRYFSFLFFLLARFKILIKRILNIFYGN